MSSLRMAQAIFDIFYPVGTYYETSNVNFNPNNDPNWYGTWVQDTKGQTLVSKSDSGTFSTLGDNVGEETHTLTTNEMPSHNHPLNLWLFNGGSASGGAHYGCNWDSNTGMMYNNMPSNWASISNTGGNQPHNNIQPSKVCIRWHRTA